MVKEVRVTMCMHSSQMEAQPDRENIRTGVQRTSKGPGVGEFPDKLRQWPKKSRTFPKINVEINNDL